MFENDNRTVMTLDAGGTNFVFTAIKGCKEVVEPIRLDAVNDDIEKCLNVLVKGFKMVKEKLEDESLSASIYITVDTLKYLKKGGRVTAAGAAIGTVLNIKPVLKIDGGKLDAFAKARGLKSAKNIMKEAIGKDIETRFADCKDELEMRVVYSYDLDAAKEFKSELEELYPDYDIKIEPLSLSVACHIGPGALAVTVSKRL